MSALAVAVLVEQQAGIETVLRYSCRDRQLRGDAGGPARRARDGPAQPADRHRRAAASAATIPTRPTVFEVDSIGLTNAVSRLNQGVDIGGQAIGRPTAFHAGVPRQSRRR